MPGDANIPWATAANEDGTFKSADELKEIYEGKAGLKEGDDIIAVGGRVLNVVGMAPTIKEARSKALLGIAKIDWPQGFCRLDIAKGK